MGERSRQELIKDKLEQEITKRVQKYSYCEGTVIYGVTKLTEPDEDGCNWSDHIRFNAGPKISNKALGPIVDQVVREARAMFNLRTE